MVKTIWGGRAALAAAAPLALALSACGDGATDPAEQASTEPSSETLAAVVGDDDGLSVVSGALSDAGLAQVFDSAAAYTILAPQDAAFDALGDAGTQLRDEAQRAALVAIIRDHIVPGYLTPEDIGNAIEAADSDKVMMRTMGGHTLTFTQDGDTIVVTNEDGSTARFAGDALRASNGVAIPVDGVLNKAAAAAPPAA
jgi:uncharacterized surface protein with fasciclin (FAS1) repeats